MCGFIAVFILCFFMILCFRSVIPRMYGMDTMSLLLFLVFCVCFVFLSFCLFSLLCCEITEYLQVLYCRYAIFTVVAQLNDRKYVGFLL